MFDTLIAQTNANLPTLHRYFRLRAKMLGVPQMQLLRHLSAARAQRHQVSASTSAASAGAGGRWRRSARTTSRRIDIGFNNRWMDAYPRPNKLSGAHMDGYAYDVHPYVLMNYNDDYESVTTMAHEWGHAMHSYLANQAQPFVTVELSRSSSPRSPRRSTSSCCSTAC